MVAGASNTSASSVAEHEDAVRAAVRAAAKATLAVPSQKQWVVEFLVESILADVMDDQAGGAPPAERAAARDSSRQAAGVASGAAKAVSKHKAGGAHHAREQPDKTAAAPKPAGSTSDGCTAEEHTVRVLLSRLPTDAAEAEARFGSLLYDSLDDVDTSDVSEFCAHLAGGMDGMREALLGALGEGGSDGSDTEEGVCEMCGRETALTKHHLIPRDVHKDMRKRGLSSDELQVGAMVCRPCHNAIHRNFDNKTLATQYNSVDKLMQ